MPFGAVKLVPGVNVEKTPTLNEAGISASQLIRYQDGLVQKYGGWQAFYPLAVGGVPRDLHAWEDLNNVSRLAIGTTTQLVTIDDTQTVKAITPQTLITNFAPNFSTVNGSPTVNVVDAGISNVTAFDSVFFNTPVTIGGIILSGLYPISAAVGTHSYSIIAATPATATVNNAGAVPVFTSTINSANVSVALANHGLGAAPDNSIVFPIPTVVNGITVSGLYAAASITDANNFVIQTNAQATASGAVSMNGGQAQIEYYIALGPAAGGVGYGLGGYGLGGYGTGVPNNVQTGTPIAAADWTTDNWGQILLACPEGGGIYYWDPTGGFDTASLISSGPIFNAGMFVSTSAQIVIAYGSTISEQIGVVQDPMLVQWSDSGNFFDWTPTDTNLARNFRIPIGSRIVTGMAVSNQNLIWTDLDLWIMNFIGFPNVYGFNKIGAGAGAASSHAAQQLRGGVYWMGASNFYRYAGSGVEVIPCPVWDAVFQNINTAFLQNVRAMPNTAFNEVGWLYPSAASVSGENDSYVKMNITEPNQPWDYGLLPRSAWIDQNVFGPPIGAIPGGVIYQHETSPDAGGQPLSWSYTTGYFKIAEGQEYAFVDQWRPDFKFGTFSGSPAAQIQMTFNVVNFPGDTPTQYGPYTVTQSTEFLSTRFRGGLVSITVSGSDLGSFSRLGYVRYRYSSTGRR
ncbi:MAG TPA: hypothetical protein VKQ27_04965 [Acetobacteraceae bacterium]|nr:hypothetical protein [Acetobacteraceae bacterium]